MILHKMKSQIRDSTAWLIIHEYQISRNHIIFLGSHLESLQTANNNKLVKTKLFKHTQVNIKAIDILDRICISAKQPQQLNTSSLSDHLKLKKEMAKLDCNGHSKLMLLKASNTLY